MFLFCCLFKTSYNYTVFFPPWPKSLPFCTGSVALKCCFLPLVLLISQSARGAEVCVFCGGTLWLGLLHPPQTACSNSIARCWSSTSEREAPATLYKSRFVWFCFLLLVFHLNVILEMPQGNYSNDRKLPKKIFGKWSGFENLYYQSCVFEIVQLYEVATPERAFSDSLLKVVSIFYSHERMLNY